MRACNIDARWSNENDGLPWGIDSTKMMDYSGELIQRKGWTLVVIGCIGKDALQCQLIQTTLAESRAGNVTKGKVNTLFF